MTSEQITQESMTPGSVRLAFVGDIMPGDSFFNAGGGLRRPLHRGMDPFEHLESLLQSHDLVFGNLEAVLSTAGERRRLASSAVMRGEPSFAGRLKEAGFNIISVANNHILQHGSECFHETLTALAGQGIRAAGVANGDDVASRPVLRQIGETRIGVLGYSCRPERFHKGPLLYAFGTKERILRDIDALKGQCDLLIVSLHWGEEFVHYPSKAQRDLAHQVIDHGADIIIGHHSHTYQGIEVYRKRLIVYSLGNFLFDSFSKLTRTGLMLSVKVNPLEPALVYDIIPIGIDERYFPVQLEGSDRSAVLAHVDQLSQEIINVNAFPEMAATQVQAGLAAVRTAEKAHFIRYVWQHPWYAVQEVAGFIARRLHQNETYIHPETFINY